MTNPTEQGRADELARWRRSQIAENVASVRLIILASAAPRRDFILLFLQSRIVSRDAFGEYQTFGPLYILIVERPKCSRYVDQLFVFRFGKQLQNRKTPTQSIDQ